eukprot:3339346-Pyramimonas_sp.AAC.1
MPPRSPPWRIYFEAIVIRPEPSRSPPAALLEMDGPRWPQDGPRGPRRARNPPATHPRPIGPAGSDLA